MPIVASEKAFSRHTRQTAPGVQSWGGIGHHRLQVIPDQIIQSTRMKHTLSLAVLLCVLAWGDEGRAATINWDGGGGDFSWQNPVNWSGDILPGLNDVAVINVPSNITVTSSANVTIASLQCSNNLALSAGTFRVRGGSSVVQGQLSTTGNPILSATGALTSFTVTGPVNADGAGFEAINATISLPGLSNYAKGTGCATVFWLANGGTGVLDFPNLTVITGAVCASLNIQALGGGQVLLPNLTSTTEGTTTFLADGVSSLVDLPVAQRSSGTARTVAFEARNNGVISLPQFTGGTNVTVTLKTGGAMPVAQLTELSGFSVTGTNVDFASLTNLTLGSITVDGGAVVRATNVVSHGDSPSCPGHTWLVTGTNSLLDLSGLNTIAGESCGFLNVQATAGGTMLLSNLTTVTEGNLFFLADGAGSLLDLGGLTQSPGITYPVSFEARNNGTIHMPQFPGGQMVSVTLKTGGMLPVAQLRELRGITVSGMTVDFPALTNITTGNIRVDGGGMVTSPLLTGHDGGFFCSVSTWEASGPGSVLDLSQLVSLSGPSCGRLEFVATSGGTVILSNLPAVTEGTLTFSADGTNSLVDLSGLLDSTATVRTVAFEVRNAGTILSPLFPGGPMVTVLMQSGGVFPVPQLRQLQGFTVTGMAMDFPGLTNLGNGNLTVSGGAVVTVPNVWQHDQNTSCPANTWLATGTGSVLSFPALTNLTGSSCGYLNVNATAGGVCQFGSLTTMGNGIVNFLADGTNSLIDLSVLTEVQATTRTVSFAAQNAGTISMPLLLGGPTVAVTVTSGGLLDVTQMTLLKGLTVSGTTLVLPGLTNLFAGDVTVSGGGVLRLPNLTSHTQSGCPVNFWIASGPGSVLDLSSLTNLTGPTCGNLNLQALGAGTILASNLQHIAGGTVNFVGDGPGSVIDLTALKSSMGASYEVSFEARNAGTVAMPLMTGGPTVGVTIKTNGVMPVAQLTRLSSIAVTGTNVIFSSLTNLDGGSISVSNAATVSAPNLVTYAQGTFCAPDKWLVSGSNSVLNLPALGILTGGSCAWLDAQALAGGQLLLGNLGSIPSGRVEFLASGNGSLIDLHSLSNFLNASTLSQMTATNGGTILLPSPMFLSGVAVNVATGTPGHSPANLAGTNVVLRGEPWHSYWVEQRNTGSPSNSWTFFRRVPLTNEFQIIAPRANASTEFRGWEFVADPRFLDLVPLPNLGVLPVLYGPTNQVFDILTTTNLDPVIVWEPYATVVMTNTFRIFALEPITTPRRFFKINDPL